VKIAAEMQLPPEYEKVLGRTAERILNTRMRASNNRNLRGDVHEDAGEDQRWLEID
jgi:hypothetical protein